MLSRGILLDVALARIEILEGRNAGDQRKLIDAVAAALSEALKAPEDDPSVRLLDHSHKRFPGSVHGLTDTNHPQHESRSAANTAARPTAAPSPSESVDSGLNRSGPLEERAGPCAQEGGGCALLLLRRT